MEKRSLFRRFFSVEVFGGAIVGVTLPYLVAFAVEAAPTRVPLGLVALSVVGCSSSASWGALRVGRCYGWFPAVGGRPARIVSGRPASNGS
jgi:hypothetical protein